MKDEVEFHGRALGADALAAAESTESFRFPADISERGLRRLGFLAAFLSVVTAVEWLIGTIHVRAVGAQLPPTEVFWDDVGAGVMASTSLAAFLVVRFGKLGVRRGTYFGIAYLVFVAFALSFTDHADYWWRDGHHLHGMPVSCLLILLFPLVIPMTTGRTLAVGAVMAAATLVGLYAVASVMAVPHPTTQQYVEVLIPNLLTAGVALVPARVVHQLGMDVRKARRLGAYRLLDRLGEGGMGEVWRAQHRFLARPAAIKLIRPEIVQRGDPEGISKAIGAFEREAQATAALQSPHTIDLYDFGVSEDGSAYYVMELLEGIDLETLVQRYGKQSPERVVHWLLQACDSLREAHEGGLVHRDVKPANIFVCRYGLEYDFVKILDFGLVALQSSGEALKSRASGEGTIFGTPAYVSPEMVTGELPVDRRADIYALGCVAYYLLTAELVFSGDAPADIMIQHVEAAPTFPRAAADEIGPELQQLVLDCLAKEPAGRPQSSLELAERLRRCPLGRPWTQERASAWWSEHPQRAGIECDETVERGRDLLPARTLSRG